MDTPRRTAAVDAAAGAINPCYHSRIKFSLRSCNLASPSPLFLAGTIKAIAEARRT